MHGECFRIWTDPVWGAKWAHDLDSFVITAQTLSVLKIITGFKYIDWVAAYNTRAFTRIWSCILHLHGFKVKVIWSNMFFLSFFSTELLLASILIFFFFLFFRQMSLWLLLLIWILRFLWMVNYLLIGWLILSWVI